MDGGDVSGIMLALDVLSMVALATDDRARGGRRWGAARQSQGVSGTGLAEWDARISGLMPHGVRNVFEPDELAHITAEGAALSLWDAVASALGEADPFGDTWARADPPTISTRSVDPGSGSRPRPGRRRGLGHPDVSPPVVLTTAVECAAAWPHRSRY